MRELEAAGGAVLDGEDHVLAAAGAWPVAPALRLPIGNGDVAIAFVLIAPRLDGRPHDPRTVAQLEEVATLVGTGLRGARTEA